MVRPEKKWCETSLLGPGAFPMPFPYREDSMNFVTLLFWRLVFLIKGLGLVKKTLKK